MRHHARGGRWSEDNIFTKEFGPWREGRGPAEAQGILDFGRWTRAAEQCHAVTGERCFGALCSGPALRRHARGSRWSEEKNCFKEFGPWREECGPTEAQGILDFGRRTRAAERRHAVTGGRCFGALCCGPALRRHARGGRWSNESNCIEECGPWREGCEPAEAQSILDLGGRCFGALCCGLAVRSHARGGRWSNEKSYIKELGPRREGYVPQSILDFGRRTRAFERRDAVTGVRCFRALCCGPAGRRHARGGRWSEEKNYFKEFGPWREGCGPAEAQGILDFGRRTRAAERRHAVTGGRCFGALCCGPAERRHARGGRWSEEKNYFKEFDATTTTTLTEGYGRFCPVVISVLLQL